MNDTIQGNLLQNGRRDGWAQSAGNELVSGFPPGYTSALAFQALQTFPILYRFLMMAHRLKLSLVLLVLNIPLLTAASAISPKLKSFEDRLAKPKESFVWLNETTDVLVKEFNRNPDGAAALAAYLKAREKVIGPLSKICSNEAEGFQSLVSELNLEIDEGLAERFEQSIKSKKNSAIVSSHKAPIERLSACLKTGLSFEGAGEGTYDFFSNYIFENSLRKKLGISEDPVLSFLASESGSAVDDMSLTMSWEDLRKKIIRWETFMKKAGKKASSHYGFIEFDVMKGIYLAEDQLDNSRTIDENGKVNKEWLSSLKTFAKENNQSALAPAVKSLLKKYANRGTF